MRKETRAVGDFIVDTNAEPGRIYPNIIETTIAGLLRSACLTP